ncbi:ankyrin repeat-containing domain protein [Hypomontagnella monticulosa]|nr:ankyrin repeat-containing domain protein [Hypomontagnella monticulosa]
MKDQDGLTPLHFCLLAGDSPLTVETLIKGGADVNMPNLLTERTPLCIAAANGRNQSIEVLLSWGADVIRCDSKGKSCLYLAVAGGHRQAAEILLDHGVEVDKRDNISATPLVLAAFIGRLDIFEFLGADATIFF